MEETFMDLVGEFWKNPPSVAETLVDILLCAVPIWLAVMIGLVIGWSWRPRWTGLLFLGLRSRFRFSWTALPPGFGARRLWIAFTALSVCRTVWSSFKGRNGKSAPAGPPSPDRCADSVGSSGEREEMEELVSEKDLEHLLQLLEGGKGGKMEWQSMMERTTLNLTYQAWQYEPQTGPSILRSRTVFEDATPELVRDFFWDDEFRPKWDQMLSRCKILEEFPQTGMMINHWIKKFPFFCSDREYIIGRRIWEAGSTYYCVTKVVSEPDAFSTAGSFYSDLHLLGVPYPALHKRDKPRRVELYFSSWVIRAVESRKGDGQKSACEVTLVHYEDMGIPKDVAKLGLRHGMWGAVKKLHSGMRAYQNARRSNAAALSRCALMAKITTKVSFNKNMDSSDPVTREDDEGRLIGDKGQEDHGIDWKWIAVGGTVALVLGLHSGAVGRALLIGAGQRLARR